MSTHKYMLQQNYEKHTSKLNKICQI